VFSGVAENRTTTFRVATVETGHAAIEKNHSLGLAFAAQAGQLELNVMLPVMLKAVLDSTDMLTNF